MQEIIFEDPYEFIPPHKGRYWPKFLGLFLPRILRKKCGVIDVECRGAELLRDSVNAGHGILLAANHSRPTDPFVLGALAQKIPVNLFVMASWSVFKQSRLQTFIARRFGGFSLYREGADRVSANAAIEMMVEAQRPLLIFPEGVVSRTNDLLGEMMGGTAFMARQAAKKRAKVDPNAKVVIHPVVVKYQFQGNLDQSLQPIVEGIEKRLAWMPQSHLPLLTRVTRIGAALLALKEMEHLGEVSSGPVHERTRKLIDHILTPLETEWLQARQEGDVVARVKNLRQAILPDMVGGQISKAERERRWRQLADLYLAQQIWFYPADYITPESSAERLLETVERFEEDLTDEATIHGPWKAVLQVGEAIEVSAGRHKRGTEDPLMMELRSSMTSMLDSLIAELPKRAVS
jgi:1-acyl-sn-glycerol-3-phosphate acyltransferase